MVLNGLAVCLTGFRREAIQPLVEKIESLEGSYSKILLRDTYCLILGPNGLGSEKHIAAVKHKIPIVAPSWLHTCESKKRLESLDDHKVGIFMGLVITCSGIKPNERETIIKLIEKHSGSYSSNLIPGSVTHLICQDPSSEKYSVAASGKTIRIVNPNWIFDCVQKGYRLDESSYLLEPSNMEAIIESDKRDGKSKDFGNTPGVRELDETEHHKMDAMDVTSHSPYQYITDDAFTLARLREYDLEACNGVLDGEVIFLSGFSKSKEDLLTAIILYCGGFIQQILTDEATIILLGDLVDRQVLGKVTKHPIAVCVKPEWVIEKFVEKARKI